MSPSTGRKATIKANNPYDDLEMSGSRAVWPQVLSIYAVKTTTDPDNAKCKEDQDDLDDVQDLGHVGTVVESAYVL